MQISGLMLLLLTALTCICVACVWFTSSDVARIRSRTRKLDEIDAELVSLSDQVNTLRTATKRIEGRQVKRDAREQAAPAADGCPDPKADPEGWKRWQNRKLQARSLQ